MAKDKTIFVCNVCGVETHKWQGRCFSCGQFNTLEVRTILGIPKQERLRRLVSDSRIVMIGSPAKVDAHLRHSTDLPELNQVLAGGLVRGQTVLLAGEPGVGKSTLLLQMGKNFRTWFYFALFLLPLAALRPPRKNGMSISLRIL